MDKLTAAQNLACGIFANPEIFSEVSSITNSREMPEGPTREIFELFEDIIHEGKQPTIEIVAARMGKELREAIVQYHNVCVSTSQENVLYYAHQVHERAVSEALGPLLVNAGYEINNPNADVLQTLSDVRRAVEDAIQGFSTGNTAKSWQQCITGFLSSLQSKKKKYKRTGFGNLDMFIGGYKPGDFNVIAARSGGGKSDIAISLAIKAARSGATVLYESLEMYSDEIVERSVSERSGVNSARMRDKNLNQSHYDAIALAADDLYKIKGITIDEPSRFNTHDLEAMINKYRPNIVFIDNLDLMTADKERREKWRQNEENCHAIKAIAKRTKTCIVGLVQLNRNVDSYDDETSPKMSDLYGGSAIEHDASWVIALKRNSTPKQIDAFVLKSRAGISGRKVSFVVDFDLHRWRELETRYDDE